MWRRLSATARFVRTSIACCATSSSSGRPGSSVRLTRRQMLAGAAAGALAAGGIYELVDEFGGETPKRVTPLLDRPDEQHLLDSVSVILDNNVEVVVPPRHHQLVTANIRTNDVRSSQQQLSDALD